MEVWVHKTILSSPRYIEVPVPNQERQLSCICVLVVSILHLSTIYLILELFRQCGIICISFYAIQRLMVVLPLSS